MNKIPWSIRCSLSVEGMRSYKGSLIDCVKRWNDLPAVSRPNASLSLEKAFNGKSVLGVRDIQTLVLRPDFLKQ